MKSPIQKSYQFANDSDMNKNDYSPSEVYEEMKNLNINRDQVI